MKRRESAAGEQTAEKRIRRSSIAGIIGCIFFGIGDWLLGWVEPGIVGRAFLLIREGHGADYSLMKESVTLVLGIAGMMFLLPGYQGMAEIAAGIAKMLMPTQMTAFAFICLPLIQMLVYVLRRQTVYKRTAALAAPVLWMAVLGAAAGCMPASPFSTGPFAFCMNGAMMVWFVFCLIKKPALDKQKEG